MPKHHDHDKQKHLHHTQEHLSSYTMCFLAVLSTIWILSIFTLVLFIKPVCGDGTVNLIVQATFGLIMLVFGFYFGTSYGSQVKTELLAKSNPIPGVSRTCCRPLPEEEESIKLKMNPVTTLVKSDTPINSGGAAG